MLPPRRDLRESLVGELAGYLGLREDEVAERCEGAAARLAASWRAAAPRTPAQVAAFYRGAGDYLYDLTRWHALVEDESALAAVGALEEALGRRARRVLDFGSGIGSLGILLARHGLEVTLAEINPSLDAYARWRLARRSLTARHLDLGREPLPRAAFDLIAAVDVLEHLPDPRAALIQLAAALRPGGTLFVHLPPGGDPLHPMHLWDNPETLLEPLEEAGLWLERAEEASLVLRRGPAPRYRLRYGLSLRRAEGGWALFSERPLAAFRLAPEAARLLAVLQEDGRTAAGAAREAGLPLARATALLEGFARRRVLARSGRTPPSRWPSVTVVVPARGRPRETRACVASLLALDYPRDLLEVLVVDDASEPPLARALAGLPVRVLRLERRAGPSAARNLGLREARGEVVAFTDNDCEVSPGWLRALVAPLCEPGVEVVGGRVLSPRPEGALGAFEAVRSPLDMGPSGGRVGLEEAVSYLPSCNLAADRRALLKLGGFDEGMELGEDVDLVWRAVRAGLGVRYEPSARVVHRHRTRLGAFLRRRADYGSSEADLQLRHPEAGRRMMLPVSGLFWLAALGALARSRRAAVLLAALSLLLAGMETGGKLLRTRRAGALLPLPAVAGAVLRQHAAELYHLGAGVSRYYGLPLLAAALLWRPLRLPALLLLLVPPAVDHRRLRPGLSPAGFALLWGLEMAAYQLGVWRGCLRHRSLRPLLPRLLSPPLFDVLLRILPRESPAPPRSYKLYGRMRKTRFGPQGGERHTQDEA
ncbi:hypothetical protein RxyAA322_24480 [Rubrobacter xylanophilus]|uniref:Glycosyltransferase 2-like domain-containing protein n=1 Tax=Rubrobacter xylanophilus TaxID=49319 RepID=A0A510HL15_9ACTN|nr:hypothetical protein RxyAA322_24480 [Rubrobacter xylanophilus]